MTYYKLIGIFIVLLLHSCAQPINSPYLDSEQFDNTLYNSFSARPKHLDPARSYSSNEWIVIQSVYETPLQYHYLKRPYTLIPGVLSRMPDILYYDKTGKKIDGKDKTKIAFSEYILTLKKGVLYQPHPSFVEENWALNSEQLAKINTLADIKKTATRELIASDFVHQIKRLAHPDLHSPIFSLMRDYIVGLDDLHNKLQNKNLIDLQNYQLDGVQALDKYRYKIKVHGISAQFLYWLAMPFFTALPPEADIFYAQKGLIDKNIVLDWFPVGTGPFQLIVNNPNKEMILLKNPNFHPEYYPTEGEPADSENGLLISQGKKLPFLDKVHFLLEKETAPYWHKFLQGYYDKSGIASDNFDQAIEIKGKGKVSLSPAMQDKNIRLLTSDSPSIYYTAFNMLDKTVGGYSERAKKIRQAISIAIDIEEYISIFINGRATAAFGPIPNGIFGDTNNYNPMVYTMKNGIPKRKSISEAKDLLAQAGYQRGIDPMTQKPLLLYFDTSATDADDQSRLDWIRKQFKKINIQLVVRASSYNRLQDKMSKGQTQLFELGWNADYPDPENFLFLLAGKNAKVDFGGENASNYQNAEYDLLFEQMKQLPNSAKRQHIIDKMLTILRQDSPWVWGFIPKSYGLYHQWLGNAKPHAMARNTLKYLSIKPMMRNAYRHKYNQIAWLPILILALLGLVFTYRFWKLYHL